MEYFLNLPTWPFTIVASLVAILGAFQVQRFISFRSAAKELINTFHLELREVYPIPANWPNKIDPYLRERFNNLSGAIGKFKTHLPKRKQRLIEDAWFRFYCCTGREVDRNCQCYHHYMSFKGVSSFPSGHTVHTDNTKTYKENLRKNVDAILKFAKAK